MLTLVSEGVYEWLVTDEQFDLLQFWLAIVLGKYVAVTSIDRSQLMPTVKETAAGIAMKRLRTAQDHFVFD
jgi:hypothetical protein